MVNIYTGQLVKVLWNGVYSQNFPVVDGVKQGGILSRMGVAVKAQAQLLTEGLTAVQPLDQVRVRQKASVT